MTKTIWTQEENTFLINNYSLMNVKQIMTAINRTKWSIIAQVRKLKLKKGYLDSNYLNSKKYNFNEYFFEKIDTPEKAYWYGFIWADGNIYNNRLTINLAVKDIDVLHNFNKSICGNYPVKYIPSKNGCTIGVTSHKMREHLHRINILPNKTYLENEPIISDNIFIYFLLGLFDGDGCFYNRFTITNTKTTCSFIQKKLKELFNIHSYIRKRKNAHAYEVSVDRKGDFIKLYHLLYQNINIFFLQRKKDKYFNFLIRKNYLERNLPFRDDSGCKETVSH